jgi:hypothetical protein
LEQAYRGNSDQFFDPATSTLVIRGTHNVSDILTDLTIPFGQLANTQRYREAVAAVHKYKPQHILGHSLGAAIALQINQQEHFPGQVTVYNAPVLATQAHARNVQDFSSYGDIISMLDTTAKRTGPLRDPVSAHYTYEH